MDAVVLDLVGTLVARLATAAGCATSAVERYLRDTWRPRHDGTLPTVTDMAADLVRAARGQDKWAAIVAEQWRRLAQAWLAPAPSTMHALKLLRDAGLRLGILSDASPEIAAAWPNSPLNPLVDAAVFSQAGLDEERRERTTSF